MFTFLEDTKLVTKISDSDTEGMDLPIEGTTKWTKIVVANITGKI